MNKILMVEEELSIVQKSLERLNHAGFELLAAPDGVKGLQMAKDKVPDLIVTSAVVPGMNGYELCKAIRHDDNINTMPIVVMTENRRMEDAFMFLGVKDFLNKPVSMDELEQVVRKKLNLSQLMNLQKSKLLIYGRPEILSHCQDLLKVDGHWCGYYSDNKDSLLETALRCAPDVIAIDLSMEIARVDDLVRKLKMTPELKNSVILTYYTTVSVSRDAITIQAQMIEVQYMKQQAEGAGAKEYLGAFNPLTFMNLINIYRKEAVRM